MNIILGISVSIDAMVVGFTVLNKVQSALVRFKDTFIYRYCNFVCKYSSIYNFKILKK